MSRSPSEEETDFAAPFGEEGELQRRRCRAVGDVTELAAECMERLDRPATPLREKPSRKAKGAPRLLRAPCHRARRTAKVRRDGGLASRNGEMQSFSDGHLNVL